MSATLQKLKALAKESTECSDRLELINRRTAMYVTELQQAARAGNGPRIDDIQTKILADAQASLDILVRLEQIKSELLS